MTDLSEEERIILTDMLELMLSTETMALLISRRRLLTSQPEKMALWPNYRKVLDDVKKFREIERRRASDTARRREKL